MLWPCSVATDMESLTNGLSFTSLSFCQMLFNCVNVPTLLMMFLTD